VVGEPGDGSPGPASRCSSSRALVATSAPTRSWRDSVLLVSAVRTATEERQFPVLPDPLSIGQFAAVDSVQVARREE
jgi:hypothetical protein